MNDIEQEILAEIERIKQRIEANKTLPKFSTNNDYMRLLVELGNDVRYLMFTAVSAIPPDSVQGYNRQEAVIVGLMIRISKLYDAVCYHVSEGQGEIVQIFSRLIYESYIRMLYIIKNGSNSADNFVFISYQSIKEGFQDLLTKKAKRKLIPIEERLIKKFELQLEEDGIEKEAIFKNRNWKLDGKSFRDLLKDLDLEVHYPYLFQAQSSAIHGDWKYLRLNHLRKEGEFYHPTLKHDSVDPRYLCPISLMCLNGLLDFLEWNQSDPDEYLKNVITPLGDVILAIDRHHEKNVVSKKEIY